MPKIPAKVITRLKNSIPQFKKVIEEAQKRDINESDTVTIVTDILSEVFGFDKYSEITREYAIKGTMCDLAVKVDGKLEYLIEVKSIGTELKEAHARQAIDYVSKVSDTNWVVLSNGNHWKIFKVTAQGMVTSELVYDFKFSELNHNKQADQELIFLLCKLGMQKQLIEEFYDYKKSVNKFMIGAVLVSEPILAALRRELRKVKPGLKVDIDEIKQILISETLKREISEDDDFTKLSAMVKRIQNKKK
ncbi:MAG: type I restriction enzyme HsdR N-terminal domain-containing protein [Kangiellaceae bacterium]|nr:type I restriction enzyme HsdR N-terminal domain-containing protein [Kangiellaceae bacterium]